MSRPLPTEEVAKTLGVDVRTVQRWCQSQKLVGAYKVGGTWLVPPGAVEKLQQGEKKQDDLS